MVEVDAIAAFKQLLDMHMDGQGMEGLDLVQVDEINLAFYHV